MVWGGKLLWSEFKICRHKNARDLFEQDYILIPSLTLTLIKFRTTLHEKQCNTNNIYSIKCQEDIIPSNSDGEYESMVTLLEEQKWI